MPRARRNEELVEEIRNGVNVEENKVQLYRQNSGLIHSQLKKYAIACNDLEDWESEAYFAIEKAVSEYDAKKGRFSTLLGWQLRAVFTRYKYKSKGIPAYVVEDMTKYKRTKASVEMEKGTVSAEEAAERAGLTPERLERVKAAMLILDTVSASTPLMDDEDVPFTLEDTIRDDANHEEETIEKIYQRDDLPKVWEIAREILTEREYKILYKIYKNQMPLWKIASEEGLTPQNVSYIRSRATQKLKYNSDLLKPFAEVL